ncbi:NADH:ubiquinone dehydrogenase subunit 4 [Clydaea vesicula]|uniref:NADH:ubiquinone dehydrogenase subunit 4 n=1 Tax=Clydaea vesicula TaxID=447962 RepID=A0AAD5Y1K6_9FUNG|nr:NADH:ubiquinone dehydrogenase subunit 4 [Clydaea vesicula]
MNTATLAIFTNDLNGILYDRYHTRTIKYYRGLVLIMPKFTVFFLIFTLANIAVPGTSGFVCEFLTFLSAFNLNPFVGVISSIAIVLAPAYSLWFFHKISYGSISPHLTTLWFLS